MPLRIKGRIDYSGCKSAAKIVVSDRIDNRGRNRGAAWTEEEKATLKKLCLTMNVRKASEHFPKRTYSAVTHMASILKIERNNGGIR